MSQQHQGQIVQENQNKQAEFVDSKPQNGESVNEQQQPEKQEQQENSDNLKQNSQNAENTGNVENAAEKQNNGGKGIQAQLSQEKVAEESAEKQTQQIIQKQQEPQNVQQTEVVQKVDEPSSQLPQPNHQDQMPEPVQQNARQFIQNQTEKIDNEIPQRNVFQSEQDLQFVQSKQDFIHADSSQKEVTSEEKHTEYIISAVQKINEEQKKKQVEESQPSLPVITEQLSKTESTSEAFNNYQKKIQNAIIVKNQGNTLFKDKQFYNAIQKYSEALRFLDPQSFYGATQTECQKMAELSSSLLYNIGVCYHNIQQYKRGILFFNEAIMVNPKYVKALWKRALCQHQLGNCDQALEDIKKAYELDKSNKEIYDSYALILKSYNENQKKEKQKMKEISEKIFNNKSQTSSPQKDPPKQSEERVEKQQQPQDKQNQGGSSFWLVPVLIGAAALGIWAFKKFK